MEVEIEKVKSRFTIKSKYNEKLVELINKYESRYWDGKERQWSLPIESIETFVNDCKGLGYTCNVSEQRPMVLLQRNGDNIELKFVQFTDKFDQFKNIENAKYDRTSKKMIIPANKLNQIMDIIENTDMDHCFNETPKVPAPVQLTDKKKGRRINFEKI